MRLIEHFFSLLAPHDCINCGQEGALLCSDCTVKKLEPVPGRCYRCFRQSLNCSTCPVCRHYSVLKHVWVRTQYNETAKQLVHELKFSFAKDAAHKIAKEIQTTLPLLAPDTIIVHIPAATTHVRQRGFDQSALIARELSYLTSLPHIHALNRLGQQRQVGASAKTRQQQMKNAFRAVSNHAIEGMQVLLVDDVLTTGSTLEAAALTLRRAGAKSVSAVVFAQA
ncbi:MAG: putative amidophosphoribosyltransferase [Candidatus Saccharibacteria bacterium]|nr:putative amidophosphoribosyltransferase [Candidatus Saccharibacteria bacterium]